MGGSSDGTFFLFGKERHAPNQCSSLFPNLDMLYLQVRCVAMKLVLSEGLVDVATVSKGGGGTI